MQDRSKKWKAEQYNRNRPPSEHISDMNFNAQDVEMYNIIPSNDNGEDFELANTYAWLKVGDYSLQIVNDADEIRVRVYPYGDELEEIDAMYIAK